MAEMDDLELGSSVLFETLTAETASQSRLPYQRGGGGRHHSNSTASGIGIGVCRISTARSSSDDDLTVEDMEAGPDCDCECISDEMSALILRNKKKMKYN